MGDAKQGLTCKGSEKSATHRDGPTRAEDDWGSRGRRFKSCHPDGELQLSGPSVGIVSSRRRDRPLRRRRTGVREMAQPSLTRSKTGDWADLRPLR